MKRPARIKIRKTGVYVVAGGHKKRVAAPISFHAIGERQDGTKVVEIRFVDHDGKGQTERLAMSAITTRNHSKIADALGDKGYVWPPNGPSPSEILKAVVAKLPSRRFRLVCAPGWYGHSIVTPLRQYGGTEVLTIDPNTGAHLATFSLGTGSLKGWARTVGKLAKKSTGLRLAIAAAFAAPLLRPLSMDSFALNLFAPTSSGKTTLLHAAASVSGMNNPEIGLPKWADSETATEQLAIGHRDNLLPLDESGDQDGKATAHLKAKMLAFMFSRNKAKTLDKSYQKKINLTVREFRVIVLSSSEYALKTIAEAAGRPRIGGEEVRFIDVPVTGETGVGVFDLVEVPKGIEPSDLGRELADNLRRDAETHQGLPLDAFLTRLIEDPEAALSTVRKYMKAFLAGPITDLKSGPDRRVAANFALIYAAAALGIDYEILPWKKKATRGAIERAMAQVFATTRGSIRSITDREPTLEVAVQRLSRKLDELDLRPVEKGKKCSEEEASLRIEADGFLIDSEALVKRKAWQTSNSDTRLLVQQQIIKSQRTDTSTTDRKVMGIPGKRRYYVVDREKLNAAIGCN